MCIMCIIFILFLGKRLSQKNQTILIILLLSFTVFQELIDYINRYYVRGFNLAEDLPLHICHYALIMSAIALYNKNQFCFEFSYLMGFTGTLIAMLTPDMTDFDNWTSYITFYIHHSLIILFCSWNIFIDKKVPSKYSVVKSMIFLCIVAIPIGLICWKTGGNYMYLREIPNVNNPLVFGVWPWYILNFMIIGVILMIFAYLPFFFMNQDIRRNNTP